MKLEMSSLEIWDSGKPGLKYRKMLLIKYDKLFALDKLRPYSDHHFAAAASSVISWVLAGELIILLMRWVHHVFAASRDTVPVLSRMTIRRPSTTTEMYACQISPRLKIRYAELPLCLAMCPNPVADNEQRVPHRV
ncbi:MAG: hypothetical protein IJU89_02420 [Alphaproteobacteria bacterium]|nr:hypothetical protein [Alphaproteobacteria bacterium]